MTVYQQFAQAGFDLNRTPLNQLPVLSVPDVWVKIAGGRNQWAQSNVFTTSGSNFHNPRSLQLAGSVEHELTGNLTISYPFNHLSVVHLPRVVDFNVPEPFVEPGGHEPSSVLRAAVWNSPAEPQPGRGLCAGLERPVDLHGKHVPRAVSAKARRVYGKLPNELYAVG
jgi:hypothetical protein